MATKTYKDCLKASGLTIAEGRAILRAHGDAQNDLQQIVDDYLASVSSNLQDLNDYIRQTPSPARQPAESPTPETTPARGAGQEAPAQPRPGSGGDLQKAQAEYNKAKAALDAIGPGPHKPSSEARAFGTRGKENAPKEFVERWEQERKAHARWKRQYSKLKKAEVAASNALFRIEQQPSQPRPGGGDSNVNKDRLLRLIGQTPEIIKTHGGLGKKGRESIVRGALSELRTLVDRARSAGISESEIAGAINDAAIQQEVNVAKTDEAVVPTQETPAQEATEAAEGDTEVMPDYSGMTKAQLMVIADPSVKSYQVKSEAAKWTKKDLVERAENRWRIKREFDALSKRIDPIFQRINTLVEDAGRSWRTVLKAEADKAGVRMPPNQDRGGMVYQVAKAIAEKPEGDTEVGGAAMGAAASAELQPGPTATANAVTELLRERMGYPEAPPSLRRSWEEALSRGQEIVEADPETASKLVADITESPRPVSDVENAVLLIEIVKLKNEIMAVSQRAAEAQDAGNTELHQALTQRRYDLRDRHMELLDVTKGIAGSEAGRALAARKMAIDDEFELDNMLFAARTARGRKLTQVEISEIEKLHAELMQKLEAAQARIAELEKAAAEKASNREHRRIIKESKKDRKAGKIKTPDEVAKGVRGKSEGEVSNAQKSSIARELAKHFISTGITEREQVIDAVHEIMADIFPSMTRTDTMNAISLYGQYTLLDRDSVKVRLRELSAEMQQLGKIEDMLRGQPPRKTGVERQARTDEARRLERVVNEMKKRLNIQSTDPAMQLKSAMDAAKTAARNRITDLENQIEARELDVKTNTPLKPDAELIALRDQLELLKAEFKKVFAKELNVRNRAKRREAAIGAIQREITRIEEQIENRDFINKERERIEDPELDALRARRGRLRAARDELKLLDPKFIADSVRRDLVRLKRRLLSRIERYQENLARGHRESKVSKPPLRLDDRAKRMVDTVERLKEQWRDRLWEIDTKKRLEEGIAQLRQDITDGVIPEPKQRKNREDTHEIYLLRLEHRRLRNIQDMRRRNAARKPLVRFVLNTAGLARVFMTTLELSYVLRQGAPMFFNAVGALSTGRVAPAQRFGRAVYKSLQAIASQEKTRDIERAIFNRPNARFYDRDGLRIMHPEEGLSKAEEVFIGEWAERLPVIPRFNRAMRVFLNTLRADTYDAMAATMTMDGTFNEEQGRAMATFINEMTGSGGLSPLGEKNAEVLNTVLFSARFTASRFQLATGHALWTKGSDAQTRKRVAQEYAKSIAGLGIMYGLVKLAGMAFDDDDERKPTIALDPRSSDFLKIRMGNMVIDPLGGLAQTVTFSSRMMSGTTKTRKGDVRPIAVWGEWFTGDEMQDYGGQDIGTVAWQFLRTKGSPVVTIPINMSVGENVIGEETTPFNTVPVPITYKDILEVMMSDDIGMSEKASVSALAIFGVGLYLRDDRMSTEVRNVIASPEYMLGGGKAYGEYGDKMRAKIQDAAGTELWKLTAPKPGRKKGEKADAWRERTAQWRQAIEDSRYVLQELGFTSKDYRTMLEEELEGRGVKSKDRLVRFRSRLNAPG